MVANSINIIEAKGGEGQVYFRGLIFGMGWQELFKSQVLITFRIMAGWRARKVYPTHSLSACSAPTGDIQSDDVKNGTVRWFRVFKWNGKLFLVIYIHVPMLLKNWNVKGNHGMWQLGKVHYIVGECQPVVLPLVIFKRWWCQKWDG